jgi:hypothetical protein
LRTAAIGVGVLGIALGVAVAWFIPSHSAPAPAPAAAVARDAAAPSSDAQVVSVDAPFADLEFLPASPDAGGDQTDGGARGKKRAPRDAAVADRGSDLDFTGTAADPPAKREDDKHGSASPDPAKPSGPPPDRWKGPLPEKYKQIPGITIDDNPVYNTVSRVRLEEPYRDLAKLDPVAYAATAKAMARKFESDAELTQIKINVTGDGKLERGPHYHFSSAQALASKDTGRLACIAVDVQPWGKPIVQAQWGAQTGCDTWTGTRVPKCSIKQLLSRAREWAPQWVLTYRGAKWELRSETGDVITEIADDC